MTLQLLIRTFFIPLSSMLFVAAAPQSVRSPDRATDRQQIERLIADWETAWNTHDMHKLASLFSEDAVWVLWTGDVWTWRQRFETGMIEVHKTVYRNSVQLEDLKFVGPDVAVLRFQSTLTGDTRFPDRTIHSRKTLVLTRSNGRWYIAWGQNTRFQSDMQPTAAAKQ